MIKKMIIGNWKMHPTKKLTAIKLSKAIDSAAKKYSAKSGSASGGKKVAVGIAPSFSHIGILKKPKSVWLGAQDVFWENPKNGGAYTGEISLEMLKNLGATFIILGHSERRKYQGEKDEIINKKVKMLVSAGFHFVLCVGESLSVRKKGFSSAKKYVANQLKKDLNGVKNFKKYGVVAYEPIWAIGTGKSDNPELSGEMAKFIKKITGTNVLYGGSVNSRNAKGFLAQPSINGALVGGASLNAKEFLKIIEIANRV